MIVYVRWYGNVVQGELLDGECMGMKQVRIPLDGHHPVALFTPEHVYQTVGQIKENVSELKENVPNYNEKESIIPENDIMPGYDRLGLEAFKEAYWDHESNHLRIDKLDEFYKLWRMATTPFGFVEAETAKPYEAPKRIVSDERMEELKQQLIEKLDKHQDPQPAPKPASPKPSKKMLRSAGKQVFQDSTQLALFE